MKKLILLLALLTAAPAIAQPVTRARSNQGYYNPRNQGYYNPANQGYYRPGNQGYYNPNNQGYYAPGNQGYYPDLNVPANGQGWMRGIPGTTEGHRRANGPHSGGYYLEGVYQNNGANNGIYNGANNGYYRY